MNRKAKQIIAIVFLVLISATLVGALFFGTGWVWFFIALVLAFAFLWTSSLIEKRKANEEEFNRHMAEADAGSEGVEKEPEEEKPETKDRE